MPAMHLNFTPQGLVTDRLVAFYEERARGGAALLTVGTSLVSDKAGAPFMLNAYDERALDGLARLNDALHRFEGARTALQINHAGAYVHSMLIGGETPVSASEHTSKFTGERARMLGVDEIHQVVDQFGRSAALAKEAGFDAVEVCASAGYLISQFLSPKTNTRDDEYGGDAVRRMRFGLEVAEQVKKAVGKETAVLFRLAGDDFVPGGNKNEQAQMFARALAKKGVDGFNVTGGWHESRVPQLTSHVPSAAFAYLAQGVRLAAEKPVAASNRIWDPRLAEELLTDWLIDLISMGRPLIADPYLPEKVRSGRFETVSHCVACNQGCFDPVFAMSPSHCMINPMAGREAELRKKGVVEVRDGGLSFTQTESPSNVVVVGGGPAGMAAAWVASRRGHFVTLLEREERLGGQLLVAARCRDRRGFEGMANEMARDVIQGDVRVELGCVDAVARVREIEPDVVIVATGAHEAAPPFPVAEDAEVVTSWKALCQDVELGRRVVVIGGGGTGCETALEIARRGAITDETARFLLLQQAESPETIRRLAARGPRDVTLVEMERKAGRDVGRSTRWVLLKELADAGVTILTNTRVDGVRAGGVEVVEEKKGGEPAHRVLSCDTVVLATGVEPERKVAEALEKRGCRVLLAGDASETARALEAVRSGFDAALELEEKG